MKTATLLTDLQAFTLGYLLQAMQKSQLLMLTLIDLIIRANNKKIIADECEPASLMANKSPLEL